MVTGPQFNSKVAQRAGLSSGEADRLVEVVLRALGRQVGAAASADFAAELPPPLNGWVDRFGRAERGRPALLEAVASTAAGRASFAIEQAATVCQILAETLRPEALRALTEALPDDVAALFVPRSDPPFEHLRVDRSHRTLAEADGASAHPVFRSPAPDRAQTESLARTAEPHAATKVSSAQGLTQEREDRTIARARPPKRG